MSRASKAKAFLSKHNELTSRNTHRARTEVETYIIQTLACMHTNNKVAVLTHTHTHTHALSTHARGAFNHNPLQHIFRRYERMLFRSPKNSSYPSRRAKGLTLQRHFMPQKQIQMFPAHTTHASQADSELVELHANRFPHSGI